MKGIWPVKTEWWGAGMVVCQGRGADFHMAQLMPMPLTVFYSSKFKLVQPFWYQLNWVVLDKGPLNGCCCKMVNTLVLPSFPKEITRFMIIRYHKVG